MMIMIIRTIIISIPDLYVFRVPVNSWQQEGHVTKSHLPLKRPKFQLLDLQAVITRIISITFSFIYFLLAFKWGWFCNRTGMSVDIGWAREIHLGSVLICRKILWVFVLRTPLSSGIPVLLLNQPVVALVMSNCWSVHQNVWVGQVWKVRNNLDWKRSSGWLESWEGLLLVTDVLRTCAETIFRVKW